MKVLSVAGYHHTGKTTVCVEIIKELRRRGHRVASIKDIHAEAFTMEKEGSNTWKHWQASQDVVFARGLSETYQIWHRQLDLNQMLARLDADWVVVEGMKHTALPRIICAESEPQLDELVNGMVFGISGKWADNHTSWNGLPVISARTNARQLVDLIEDKVFDVLPQAEPECCGHCGLDCHGMVAAILAGERSREDCVTDRHTPLSLHVNGKEITIVPFVQNMLRDTVLAMVKNLKGVEPGSIQLTIHDK
jgi:molybdopterin-guanine dinucleotide biosynthesis protein B